MQLYDLAIFYFLEMKKDVIILVSTKEMDSISIALEWDFGRNGIGLDTLKKSNDKISLHYQSKLISAGRVVRNYRWDRTIR